MTKSRKTTAEPAEGSTVLQLRKIGNSVGIILPKEVLARARLEEGDLLEVVDQTEGGLKLLRHDALHEKAMNIARKAMREYANTLRALAK